MSYMSLVSFLIYLLSGCEQFDGSHTAARTAAKLQLILAKYGILDKVWHCQSDSANTMIAGE